MNMKIIKAYYELFALNGKLKSIKRLCWKNEVIEVRSMNTDSIAIINTQIDLEVQPYNTWIGLC